MRMLVLIIGPPVLVGLSYWLTLADGGNNPFPLRAAEPRSALSEEATAADEGGVTEAACHAAAGRLAERLDGRFRVIVRPPYVIAGDFRGEVLDRCHASVVVPVSRALSTSYFDRKPDEPISIVLCASDESYRRFARLLDGRDPPSRYGYYQRAERRILANTATGHGTLAHELTHALAHFDFPRIPRWFDEGLATVHEQAEYTGSGRLRGLSNWRLNVLLEAKRRNRLEPLESFLSRPIDADPLTVDYAHARYFCLYLQRRRLLEPFYRKFRYAVEHDPTGLQTLKDLLQVDSAAEIDRDFRRWVATLRPAGRPNSN